MATVEVTPATLIIRLNGADRLWAFTGQLEIPRAQVLGAASAAAEARQWLQEMRLGGSHYAPFPGVGDTHRPGVLSAGRLYEHGHLVFWDVHHPERAIGIAVRDEFYKGLVIEVDDPAATVAAIGAVLATAT